jgi:hypothetical protein
MAGGARHPVFVKLFCLMQLAIISIKIPCGKWLFLSHNVLPEKRLRGYLVGGFIAGP